MTLVRDESHSTSATQMEAQARHARIKKSESVGLAGAAAVEKLEFKVSDLLI